jgi:hypothetical protein
MNKTSISSDLTATSRLIGADIRFLQLVELVAKKQTGAPSVGAAAAQERIDALLAEFRQECAAIFEKRLGPEHAPVCLAALESAAVQRYLVARQTMGPALAQRLAALKQRMGNIEL